MSRYGTVYVYVGINDNMFINSTNNSAMHHEIVNRQEGPPIGEAVRNATSLIPQRLSYIYYLIGPITCSENAQALVEVDNDVISGVAIDNISMDVPIKFGDSRSDGFREGSRS